MIREPQEIDVRLTEYAEGIEEGEGFGLQELNHIKELYAEAGRRWVGLDDAKIVSLIVQASEIIVREKESFRVCYRRDSYQSRSRVCLDMGCYRS